MGPENKFYYKLCLALYLMGTPNLWIQDLKLPTFVTKCHNAFWKVADGIAILWIVSEEVALFTQKNLNEKQRANLILFCIAHPIQFSFAISVYYHRKNIREVMRYIVVNFKEVYSNAQVEGQASKRAKFYSILCSCFSIGALVFYGIEGVKNGSLITALTAWPDVKDDSNLAKTARVVIYVIWWFTVARMSSGFLVIIAQVISLSHRYTTISCYFYSLNNIFEENITQEEKEEKYERAFKVGIKMHSDALRCVWLTQRTSSSISGGQVTLNVSLLFIYMTQLINLERTLSNAMTALISVTCLLIFTSCLMCNAGNITIEASRLGTAMFSSGWHNCRGASARRVRALLTVSIWRSQRPVELKCFGVITLSYEAYLSVIKASYTLLSVFY